VTSIHASGSTETADVIPATVEARVDVEVNGDRPNSDISHVRCGAAMLASGQLTHGAAHLARTVREQSFSCVPKRLRRS
jgi:hypothetical protein